jgi:hypothetical protein
MKQFLQVLVLLFLICISAGAAPSGTSVSAVGNNNATFSAGGFDSAGGWFEYGLTPQSMNAWTSTETPNGSSITWTESGSPLTTSTTFYVTACDATGCDPNAVSFTTLAATPFPSTTYGYLLTNASKNKYNPLMFVTNWGMPYVWLWPANAMVFGISVITAIVLFCIFYGAVIRNRGVSVPVSLGIVTAPFLLTASAGMYLGMPVEFQGIAQGCLYACLAGIFLIWLKK